MRVGYHIGQQRVGSQCELLFVTAGILLEQLRTGGLEALTPNQVVVLDEVHERSMENDLVLCSLKKLLQAGHRIRVVLMSATLDAKRYADYFEGIARVV